MIEVNRAARQYFSTYPWVNSVAVCSNACFNIEEKNRRLQILTEIFNAMDESYYNTVAHVLKAHEFDVVQVEHFWMSWGVSLIRTVASLASRGA